jgi:hypothetical protein
VSLEDRQDLLGDKSDRITTHYSAPDITRLVEAANKVCEQRHTVPRVIVPQAVSACVSSKRRRRRSPSYQTGRLFLLGLTVDGRRYTSFS